MPIFIVVELAMYLILFLAGGVVLLTSRMARIYIRWHWVKIAIITGVYALIRLAVWGFMSMESFYAKLTLAQLPLQILLFAFNAAVFVYMYTVVLGRGFSSMSKKSKVRGEFVNIKWSDVIGMDNVKQEAREVVELIKDRARVKKIGGKILRGILMIGPPGCGKTYLAKAISTETGMPFLAFLKKQESSRMPMAAV
jgi:cell division protease FtsH